MNRTSSYALAPILLLLSALFAGWNWYLQPERAGAWGASIALVAVMALVLLWADRSAKDDPGPGRAADTLRHAITSGGFLLVVSLGLKLAGGLGVLEDPDLERRSRMVVVGAFFMFTGNALPKWLTPLSQPQCDGSKAQAFQRFMGWTWTLTGIAYALVWLVVPIDLAKSVSIAVLVGGMIAVASQGVRLYSSRKAA